MGCGGGFGSCSYPLLITCCSFLTLASGGGGAFSGGPGSGADGGVVGTSGPGLGVLRFAAGQNLFHLFGIVSIGDRIVIVFLV